MVEFLALGLQWVVGVWQAAAPFLHCTTDPRRAGASIAYDERHHLSYSARMFPSRSSLPIVRVAEMTTHPCCDPVSVTRAGVRVSLA